MAFSESPSFEPELNEGFFNEHDHFLKNGYDHYGVTMNQLGFTWYGQLVDAMNQEGIAQPGISAKAQAAMVDTALKLLSAGHVNAESVD